MCQGGNYCCKRSCWRYLDTQINCREQPKINKKITTTSFCLFWAPFLSPLLHLEYVTLLVTMIGKMHIQRQKKLILCKQSGDWLKVMPMSWKVATPSPLNIHGWCVSSASMKPCRDPQQMDQLCMCSKVMNVCVCQQSKLPWHSRLRCICWSELPRTRNRNVIIISTMQMDITSRKVASIPHYLSDPRLKAACAP